MPEEKKQEPEYMFGFECMGDRRYIRSTSPEVARGLLPANKQWFFMRALPVDLGYFRYRNVNNEHESKTREDLDEMWRSDRGPWRHEK